MEEEEEPALEAILSRKTDEDDEKEEDTDAALPLKASARDEKLPESETRRARRIIERGCTGGRKGTRNGLKEGRKSQNSET